MLTRSNMTLMSSSALILALATSMTVTPAAEEDRNSPFQGAWRTVEVIVEGPTARTFKPDATLAIFHGRYYSRTEVHSEQPRALLADPIKATADDLRAVWGPFVGEAGTFELSGNDVITMQATVAKNPAAMANAAVSVYTYKREGNTLTLTQVRTHAGPVANPVTIKLLRVE